MTANVTTTPVSLDPIVVSTAEGITKIAENSLLGAIAVVCLGIAALLTWVILKQARDCHEGTKKGLENASHGLANNTAALHGIQVVLAEIKVKLDK